MAGEAEVVVVGHVGGEPELRFTPGGDAVATFSVASTPRVKRGDSWEDGETTWFRATAWKQDAEAVAEHVQKGMLVRVEGRLKLSTYEAKDGSGTRTSLEVTAGRNGVSIIPKPPKKMERQEQAGEDPWGEPAF